jgi:asparagine synthase (glutamine-hydrolysing)
MCGIAGIWNCRPGFEADAAVASMLDAMQHRGPDGRGTFAFDGGAAGMVRLALVDLSPRGMQPIWSADRRVAVLFNGEIYNFRAERERLSRSGVAFHTGTDTEVILQLYLEDGENFVDRLRGMFAVAVFDWRNTSAGALPVLTLVRGPLGIKPLYIAVPDHDSQAVAFSSEVRGLLAGGIVARRVDPDGLADFLACGYVVQPRTIISGVRMLEAGWLERYSPGKPVCRRQFWRTPRYQPRHETLDESAARLRGVLEESIALHAFADAPVGAFLSGGVDSTGIVGLMRKHVADLRTYTLAYPDAPQRDESEYAIETAARFDCRNTVVEVRGSEMPEVLPEFARAMDQPSSDGLNTWLVSRAAAHDVKAVLSGVGGDEWFSGYPVTRRMAYYAVHPMGRVKALAGNVAALLTDMLPEGKIRQRAYNLATRKSSLSTWLHAHSVFRHDQALRMVGRSSNSFGQIEQFDDQLSKLRSDFVRETPIGLACLLDFGFYMGSQLLRDADAMSMWHSLELRTPFVDTEVVEFSRSCQDDYKLRYDGGLDGHYSHSGAKRVLIHALRDVLPAGIAQRPKRGFALPMVHWMRNELRPMLMETCDLKTIERRGLVDPAMVAPLVQGAEAISANLYPRLWTLMMLELWCRATLDVPVAAPVGSR